MANLLVIIDCSPSTHVSQAQFGKWIDSIISFCNSHLMIDEKNDLTVIASFVNVNKLVISSQDNIIHCKNVISQQGQFEKFAFITETIKSGLIDLVKGSKITNSQDCLLAGALGMALCKLRASKAPGGSRILVASCSMHLGSYANQYMDLMNSFFAAQRMNIPIDGCVFMKDDSKRGSMLEQGCDLTGGHFLNTPDMAGNLEYLLWIFLPHTQIRENLLLPERRRATHRAACFCHRNIIDIGYVCSVCLSLYCTFSPICSNCQSHFKVDIPPRVINKLEPNSKSHTIKPNRSTTT